MKLVCTKGVWLKRLTIVAVLALVTMNLTLTGLLAPKRMSSALYLYNFKQDALAASDTTVTVNSNTTESKFIIESTSSDGFNLANRLSKKCNRSRALKNNERVFGSYEWGTIETCIIWKIGTTFIKRLYMMKNLPQFHEIINPYEIRFDKRYLPKSTIHNSQAYTRFMFVRDPYSRLISGYVDKLLAPNPIYWQEIGVPAIRVTRKSPDKHSLKCGHNLQFHEYVKYVIKAMGPRQKNAKVDGHFERMTSLCKPCGVNYNFVGKMEHFAEDSLELLRHLNVSDQTINILDTEGDKFAWLDALEDTAHQPFDVMFRKHYVKCISFYEALNRSWKKMRIRGIIGRQEFPLKESETKTLTESEFVRLAIKAREKSTSEERKLLQKQYFLQMFSFVSNSDLEMIRTLYAADFELFEYNDKPDILFQK